MESALPVLLLTVLAYGIGCLNMAYYVVRILGGTDLRSHHSGNAGARNAGRVLGAWGFALAFLGDFGKGMAVVVLAEATELGVWATVLAMAAAVAGHNHPVQLDFRGGRGIACGVGAAMMVDWRLTVGCIAIFAVLVALTRRFTQCGVIVIALSAIPGWFVLEDRRYCVGLAAMGLLILIASWEKFVPKPVRAADSDAETRPAERGSAAEMRP